jgi:hypothetical protein
MDALDKALADAKALVASQEATIAELKTAMEKEKLLGAQYLRTIVKYGDEISAKHKVSKRLQEALLARGATEEEVKALVNPSVAITSPSAKRSNAGHQAWQGEVLAVFHEMGASRGVIVADCKDHDEFKKKCKGVGLTRLMARQEASARRARAGAPAPSLADELGDLFGGAPGVGHDEEETEAFLKMTALTLEEGTKGAPSGGGGGGGGGKE